MLILKNNEEDRFSIKDEKDWKKKLKKKTKKVRNKKTKSSDLKNLFLTLIMKMIIIILDIVSKNYI